MIHYVKVDSAKEVSCMFSSLLHVQTLQRWSVENQSEVDMQWPQTISCSQAIHLKTAAAWDKVAVPIQACCDGEFFYSTNENSVHLCFFILSYYPLRWWHEPRQGISALSHCTMQPCISLPAPRDSCNLAGEEAKKKKKKKACPPKRLAVAKVLSTKIRQVVVPVLMHLFNDIDITQLKLFSKRNDTHKKTAEIG